MALRQREISQCRFGRSPSRFCARPPAESAQIRIMQLATFSADITPPVGHPLCAGWYPPAREIRDRLRAMGVILFPAKGLPIVLCALDWAELSNGEHDLWRSTLAAAVATEPQRVAVHCTHAHDTPWPDREAEFLLKRHGKEGILMERPWADGVLRAVGAAAAKACQNRRQVSGLRTGRARVEGIASNRRVIGPDGRSLGVRWTQCKDPALREAPEGLIDPWLKTLSFWDGADKVAALHYYAVHPTTLDGTGQVHGEFPALARNRLTAEEGVPHLYFTECAGNITAGKYNDGSTDQLEFFAEKLERAMRAAEAGASDHPLTEPVWKSTPLALPENPQPEEETLKSILESTPSQSSGRTSRAALIQTFRERRRAGKTIEVSSLRFGEDALLVHLPGEAFIEYQCFAQQKSPCPWVAVPAYGDCGPGYICLDRSFAEGGYEPTDAFCGPGSETAIKQAIEKVIDQSNDTQTSTNDD